MHLLYLTADCFVFLDMLLGTRKMLINLQHAGLLNVRPNSSATFGQGHGWWDYQLTLPIGPY
ncbi:unnamed protein product [Absidia cylindrospora]